MMISDSGLRFWATLYMTYCLKWIKCRQLTTRKFL